LNPLAAPVSSPPQAEAPAVARRIARAAYRREREAPGESGAGGRERAPDDGLPQNGHAESRSRKWREHPRQSTKVEIIVTALLSTVTATIQSEVDGASDQPFSP
jgi:hypothetical protein